MTTQIGTPHKELPKSPFDVISGTLVGIASGFCSSFDSGRFAELLLAETFNPQELSQIRELALDCLVRTDFDKWVLNRDTRSDDLRSELIKITTLTHSLLKKSSEQGAANVVDYNSTAYNFGAMAMGLVEYAREELRLET